MMGARDPIVVMTGEQLRALVSDVLETALARVGAQESSDILNVDQVAAILGVHERTVEIMIKRDALPTLRRVGKHWRFSRRAVLAWLEAKKEEHGGKE